MLSLWQWSRGSHTLRARGRPLGLGARRCRGGAHPRPCGLGLVAHRHCTALASVRSRGRAPRARTPDRAVARGGGLPGRFGHTGAATHVARALWARLRGDDHVMGGILASNACRPTMACPSIGHHRSSGWHPGRGDHASGRGPDSCGYCLEASPVPSCCACSISRSSGLKSDF